MRLEVDVFFNSLDNLHVLGLSSLPNEVSDWNKDMGEEALQLVFFFATKHL